MWDIIKYIAMLILFILMMLFVGCTSKEIQYVNVKDDNIKLYANEIQQTNLVKVDTTFFNIESTEYACVKTKDYVIVIKNYQQLKAYIKQQKDVIEFYERQIKDYESRQ